MRTSELFQKFTSFSTLNMYNVRSIIIDRSDNKCEYFVLSTEFVTISKSFLTDLISRKNHYRSTLYWEVSFVEYIYIYIRPLLIWLLYTSNSSYFSRYCCLTCSGIRIFLFLWLFFWKVSIHSIYFLVMRNDINIYLVYFNVCYSTPLFIHYSWLY